MGSHRRRNHPCQILVRLTEGLWDYGCPKSGVSSWLWSSPLQQCYALPCYTVKILYLTFKLLWTTQPPYLYDLICLQSPRNTRSSSVVTVAGPPTRSTLKITSRSFRYASPYLWNQLPHSLRQPRLDLPLPDSPLPTVISPPECHHHYSYHPSPRHSSIPKSKLSYFSNPTLHGHLAPLRTDFTDTRIALRLFFCLSFFLVFSWLYFLPCKFFCPRSLLSVS